jgi:hypothetical protein
MSAWAFVTHAWRALASLKLTVACLVAAMLLVLLGTFAQMEWGIWEAKKRYFSSWFVWWYPYSGTFGIPWFPGGLIIGGLLAVNLIAAQTRRFKAGWNTLGNHLTHTGLLILLGGGFLTDTFSREGLLVFSEGESKNYSEDSRAYELVLVEPLDNGKDRTWAIPSSSLATGQTLSPPGAPLTLKTIGFWRDAVAVRKDASRSEIAPTANRGFASQIAVIPAPMSVKPNEKNLPAAVLEIADAKSQDPLGSWLATASVPFPQWIQAGGRRVYMVMRPLRYYFPFELKLLNFQHRRYPGTDIPKDFSSFVRLLDVAHGEDRETRIFMNNPLRYRGRTFYQHSFGNADTQSILQVVRNPAWAIPYIACSLISIGLLWEFGWSLAFFLREQRRRT